MDVLIWTLIFLGGDLAIIVFLVFWAWKKDREKAAAASDT